MSIAVIRNMDTQGRIIIPADIRKETGIRSGSTLEIATDGTTIRIRKCTPRNTGSKELRDFLEPLYKNIRCGLAISSTDCILGIQRLLSARRRTDHRGTALSYPGGQRNVFSIRSLPASSRLLPEGCRTVSGHFSSGF